MSNKAKRTVPPLDIHNIVMVREAGFGSRQASISTDLGFRFNTHSGDDCMVLRFLTGVVGLTKAQICRETGLTPSALGHFFKGRRALPVERRKQLLELLSTVVRDFSGMLEFNERLAKTLVEIKADPDLGISAEMAADGNAETANKLLLNKIHKPLLKTIVKIGTRLYEEETRLLSAIKGT